MLSRRERRDVRRVERQRRGHDLVRHRVDRPARRCSSAGRPHLGGVRRLRPGRPLRRRRRPARTSSRRSRPATSSRARSPSTPTASRSSTRAPATTYLRASRIDRAEPTRAVDAVGRRGVSPTKWNDDWDGVGAGHRRLPVRGRREQPVPHREAQPVATAPTGKVTVAPAARVQRAGLGRRAARATSATRTCRSRTRSPSPATPSTSPTPAAWCRAGTSPGWPRARRRTRMFRFWTGDDTDASIVDRRGGDALRRVGVRAGHRAGPHEVGQIMKLDPSKPDDPLVWKVDDHDALPAGMWATPAIYDGHGRSCPPTAAPPRRRPGDRRGPVGDAAARADVAVAGGRRRRADPGRLQRRPARLRRVRHRRQTRRSCGRSSSAGASSRRRRCGTAASTSAPAPAGSAPSATDRPTHDGRARADGSG